MSDELLTEDELREAKAEAGRILAQPTKEYRYTTEWKGGPRNVDPQTLAAAAVELTTARLVLEEMTDRRNEAEFLFLEQIEVWREAGIPVEQIAQYTGLKYRSSVYRAEERLAKIRKQRQAAQDAVAKIQENT